MKTRKTLMSPKLLVHGSSDFEVSVHMIPSALRREVRHVFPVLGCDRNLMIVATNQKAEQDLVNWGEDVSQEKDRLLHTFMSFADNLSGIVMEKGHFCDYIDPCSGLPFHSGGNNVYDEVQGMQMLFQYPTMDAGCCKVLLHPRWGPNVYPASIFTNAPAGVIINLLDALHISSSETD